jgi:phosphonate transport system substrate-binding protein
MPWKYYRCILYYLPAWTESSAGRIMKGCVSVMKAPFGSWFLIVAFASGILLSLDSLAAENGSGADPPPLIFGVLNQQSPIQTAERWNPVLRYLQRKTGRRFQLKMGATVELTDAMMGREEFDLIFTNHNFHPGFDGKYAVLARWAGKPIHGVIVVPHDSPIRRLTDLQDRTVAFPSADAFVAYAVPTLALRSAGVGVVERFAGNQDGALAQVKARRVDAAAVNSRFLEAFPLRDGFRLRTIHASEGYHEIPVVIHPRVPSALAAEIRATLIGMAADPAAADVLKAAKCPGFEAASEQDYDNQRHAYRLIEP